MVAALGALALHQHLADHPHRAGVLLAAAVGAAIAGTLVIVRPVRWLAPAVVPLLAGAAIGLVHGGLLAAAPAAMGIAAAVGLAAGIDVAGHERRIVERVARVLSTALGAVAFCLAIAPAWAWNRLTGGGAVDGRRRPTGWSAIRSLDDPARLGATTAASGRRTLVGRLAWAIGAVALIVATDYGVGRAWTAVVDRGPSAADAAASPASPPAGVARDPRIDAPAMAGAPWREQYFADFARTRFNYWPYTESRPVDFSSPHINVEGWERRSYQAPGDAAGRPEVWFFGGSTAWGEGQRDEHTIPSELVRLSADAGTPITVRNLGQRGWTHFQAMVLFEQRLAIDEPPDLAIFYDGLNEVVPQALVDEPVPSHYLASIYAEKLVGSRLDTQLAARTASAGELLEDVRAEYLAQSALARTVRWALGTPALAQASQEGSQGEDGPDASPGINTNQTKDDQGTIIQYDLDEQDGVDAAEVYERGRAITSFLAERHDVPALFFWQPIASVGPAQIAARERLSPPTIDIADALDEHQDTYIDLGHTNEEGARIVAEAIWVHLAPEVAAWYEDQP